MLLRRLSPAPLLLRQLAARPPAAPFELQCCSVGAATGSRAFATAAHDDPAPGEYEPLLQEPVRICHKLSVDVLQDPSINKGTAFPEHERERLGLRGLLPSVVSTMDVQLDRVMRDLEHGLDQIPPEDVGSGITREMERRWRVLQGLQARNETLYYRVLVENFTELAPIVYTPTVGWVCTNFHTLWRRPRGMFFTMKDKGQLASMVYNWPQEDVSAIVVTDGSRILGLGDLGVNGLGIPIGKLDLYVAAAGFHPAKVLPCVIDVGTNNERLLNDPLYVGIRERRIKGRAYYDLLDEFVKAITLRWPNAVLQFEDFSIEHALPLLQRYRDNHLIFNDDIQGTAGTAVSGLYGAMRALGRAPSHLAEQRVVCVGAGSAGMGVVGMIAKAMQCQGASQEAANDQFWVIDAAGLVTEARPDLPRHVKPFARDEREHEGKRLLEVVRMVKPTVLLGLSGAGRLFTPEVLREVASHVERPIIFPMSNPTSKMECTAEEAFAATEGRCVFACGSPQDPVTRGGKTVEISQANNLYIFPGVALGAYLGKTGTVTDRMFMAAAEEIPKLIQEEDVEMGMVFPRIKSIRQISAAVAVAVIKAAAADGHLGCPAVKEALSEGDHVLLHHVEKSMYSPKDYGTLAYRPPGIGE